MFGGWPQTPPTRDPIQQKTGGAPTIGCICDDIKKVSDGEVCQALIIVKLRGYIIGLNVPQLVRFLRKYYRHISRDALIRKVHRALDKLEEEGLVFTEVVGSYRFARLTEKGLKVVPWAVDLIKSLARTKPALKEVVDDLVKERYLMNILPNYRASEEWWDVARRLLIKPPIEYTEFDKEYLELSFEVWKENIRDKVLMFVDPEGELVYLPYETRFTSERYAKKLIAKFNKAWAKATEMFDVGVFLTITLPPIFPPVIQKYALTYLRHRIKAYLRKKYGDKILFASDFEGEVGDLKTPPHISVYEPQKKYLNPHLHDIYFGITRIMDKRDITRWLDDLLIRFLSRMGHHIQKTVNNRLTEEQVKWFNKYGKKLLKKYLRYKKKHPKYRGPINWVTQVKRKSFKTEDGRTIYYWEFAHPPPDYVKFMEEVKKQAKLSTDGGSYSPVDYLRKYLLKNLREVINDSEEESGESAVKEKERKRRKIRLAWYWLARARFYTVSPIFRVKDKKRRGDSGWRFVGSFKKEDLEYFEWLESRGMV